MNHINLDEPELRFPAFSDNWCKKRMKDICVVSQGLQIPISERFTENGENRYFYITNEFLKENSEKEYYIENPPKSVICTEKDVLMTRTGNTGKVITNVNGVFHNNFFKIDYDDSIIDKDFLCYFLNNSQTQKIIMRLAGTSTIPDLNHSDFYSIKINYPSLPEQRKISDFLKKIDKKIESLEKIQNNLQEVNSKLINNIMEQKYKIPKHDNIWNEIKLKDIGDSYTGLSGKTKEDFEKGNSKFIPYLSVFNDIILNDCNFENVDIKSSEKQNSVVKGDIFFTGSSETPKEVGMSSVLLEDIENCYLNSFCFGFRLKSFEQYNPLFLVYYFRSLKFRKELYKLAQGSTRFNISKKELLKKEIAVPSKIEQDYFANVINRMFTKNKLINKELGYMENFKKGLLQKMFV